MTFTWRLPCHDPPYITYTCMLWCTFTMSWHDVYMTFTMSWPSRHIVHVYVYIFSHNTHREGDHAFILFTDLSLVIVSHFADDFLSSQNLIHYLIVFLLHTDGTYGFGCSQQCSCQNDAICNQATGNCACQPGWHGPMCQHPCPNNYYGNCLQSCGCEVLNVAATCNPVTGTCMCLAGWTGRYCQEMCADGRYGVDCVEICRCENGACDRVDGTCTCLPGWRGSSCNRVCQTGYYGDECSQVCQCQNGGVCDHVTGACACVVGWQGDICDIPCEEGTYGLECSEQCQCSSANTVSCNKAVGTCLCMAGWIGPTCGIICAEGSWGRGCQEQCECQHGAHCNHENGICTCTAGYIGDLCQSTCEGNVLQDIVFRIARVNYVWRRCTTLKHCFNHWKAGNCHLIIKRMNECNNINLT